MTTSKINNYSFLFLRKRVWFVAANDAIAVIVASVGAIDGASDGATLCFWSPPDAAIIMTTVTATALNSTIYEQNVLIYLYRPHLLSSQSSCEMCLFVWA